MVLFYGALSIVTLLLFIGALIDIITKDDSQVQHLPKLVWIIIVILLPFVGSVLWFLIGREWPARRAPEGYGPVSRSRRPSADGPGRLSTEEQLARLDREIAEEEARARIRELEAELERRRGEQESDS